MTCERIKMPGGGYAIVCSRGRHAKPKPCVSCGEPALRLCDWKVKGRKSGTCDRPICERCSVSPAEEKDLCPEHAAHWERLGRPGEALLPPPLQTDFFGTDQ